VNRLPGLLLLIACAAGVATAHAALQALEQVHELGLRAVSLPSSATGRIVLRRCAGCRPETLAIDAGTRFQVRPAPAALTLADFRAAFSRASRRRAPYVYIYYEPRGRVARRVVLDPGP